VVGPNPELGPVEPGPIGREDPVVIPGLILSEDPLAPPDIVGGEAEELLLPETPAAVIAC
jgi:hypothetical protein